MVAGGPAAAATSCPSGWCRAAARRVGKELITRLGCGSCHEIPGIKGADGLVGPPLTKFGRRQIIAGQLGNTPENLVRWLMDPKEVEPGTDMPDLGITPDRPVTSPPTSSSSDSGR